VADEKLGALRWWCLNRATGRFIAYGQGRAPICTEEDFEMLQTRDVPREPTPHEEGASQ
jgi:hypothetical protein